MGLFDVAVIGSGPAGTALVDALVRQELNVVWIAPDLEWSNTYGLWVDEVPQFPDIFEATWGAPMMATDKGVRYIDRTYGRVDNNKLQQALSASTRAHRIHDSATGCVEDSSLITIQTTNKQCQARLVFDCSGHKPALLKRPSTNVGFQTAYGVVAQVSGEPLDGHDIALMDFRTFDDWEQGPTFLYAMRLPDGRWFLEETVLVGRPPVPIASLKTRLHARLASRGVDIVNTFEEERCVIPMGDALPEFGRIAGFGGAASFVHPATGYMVARALNAAQNVAEVTASSLQNGDGAAVWNSVWPREKRSTRHFYLFGMETLLGLDTARTHAFFDAFFELPPPQWQGYLADTLKPAQVAATMMRLFLNAGIDMKAQLAQSVLSKGQIAHLTRALIFS